MRFPPFSAIAPYYDILMSDVAYDEWVDYIAGLCPEYRGEKLRILDMACGTGVCAVLFRRAGHEVIVLDSSAQMLDVARKRFARENVDIEILEKDMRQFSIEGKVDLVTCLFDSVNNLTEEDDLDSCFRCVAHALKDSGLFIFDMNTDFGLSTFWGNRTIVKEKNPVLSIWRNSWDQKRRLATLDLTLFIRENDVYRRVNEVHVERGYSGRMIAAMLRRAGF
ncbi:MAG: class I SAM-dependent DNA methyltransferase, partial [bacterium]